MYKRILLVGLLILLVCQPVMAFSLLADSMQQAIRATWNAQTIEQLEQGVIAIPQAAVNDYLSAVLADYPDISAVQVIIYADNRLALDLTGRKTGKLRLEGKITRFVQNADESFMEVHIDKRKLVGQPVTSWFFAHLSLGMLFKLFGNPLAGSELFTSQIHGNTVIINFKPYIEQSPLQAVSIMNTPLLNMIAIDGISTDEGMIYLHTSYHGPQQLLDVLKRVMG